MHRSAAVSQRIVAEIRFESIRAGSVHGHIDGATPGYPARSISALEPSPQ